MENIKTEFINTMKRLCDKEDMDGIIDIGLDSEKNMRIILDFIKTNNITDCSHLWEDSEEGEKSYEAYEKILLKAIDLCEDDE